MKKLNLLLITILISACTTNSKISDAEKQKSSAALNAFFDADFEATADRSPETLTFLGSRKRYAELDDDSYENFKKEASLFEESLAKVKSFDPKKLDEQTKISYDLYENTNQDLASSEKFYFHRYFLSQMSGRHSDLVEFMINQHQVYNEPQAWSYISRLQGFEKAIDDLVAKLNIQKGKGIKYPNLIFAHAIRDCKNIISGYPFQNVKKDSELYRDFRTKVARIDAEPNIKNILMLKAKHALRLNVQPAYERLISTLIKMEKANPENQGVWALPDGDEYYRYRLKKNTTTDLTPAQVHSLGLKEVVRIQDQMKALMKQMGFSGTLKGFFESVKKDPKLYYSNNYKGRQDYLRETQAIIDNIQAKTDDLFNIKPKAKLVVKAVEKYREQSAPVAFYEAPAPDGSRPAVYYVNMADMSTIPKFDMEALAYHEAIPGHHFQIAIAQELKGIPKFRLYENYTAYVEGWGLYAERLPKELGFYKDPYSEFGRLSMELWRAARLVVDPGIHYYKWTREQAIDYLSENTPNSLDKNTKEVERYFVIPGQAVAYKVGQLKILELRQKAERALKSKFNLKEFHDVLLKNGSLPFTVLEQVVDSYIKTRQKSDS
jgi:uncharacterized protein (DUF885 family)